MVIHHPSSHHPSSWEEEQAAAAGGAEVDDVIDTSRYGMHDLLSELSAASLPFTAYFEPVVLVFVLVEVVVVVVVAVVVVAAAVVVVVVVGFMFPVLCEDSVRVLDKAVSQSW